MTTTTDEQTEVEQQAGVDPNITHESEWQAARTAMSFPVATNYTERTRTFNMMAAGYPMYATDANKGSADPLDLSWETFGNSPPPTSLATLQASGSWGTTAWTGKPSYTTGQFVLLGDASKAHWNGTAWAAGAKT